MRTIWKSERGDRFDSYEEAYDDAREKMDLCDFADRFEYYVNYEQLLNWAMKQDNFWQKYEDAYSQAEQDYFEDFYTEVEVEDDEE